MILTGYCCLVTIKVLSEVWQNRLLRCACMTTKCNPSHLRQVTCRLDFRQQF